MSEILVNKIVRITGEDRLTSVLAHTNQAMEQLQQHMTALGMKFNSSASESMPFRTSLDSIKANAGQTNESLEKLNNTIDKLKGDKKVKFDADTTQATDRTKQLDDNIKALRKNNPTIKPKYEDGGTNEKLSGLARMLKRVKNAGSSMTKSFVAGNLISNGIQSAYTDLKQFAIQGFQAAAAGEQTAARWKSLGMTAGGIKQVGAAVADLKENTNLSGAAAGNLVTRFYGLTGSTSRAIALAKGVGSISDSLRLSRNASDAFANGLARIEASGKVTSQSLGRLERQAPGITSALQKASGMSKKSFDDLLSSGKMTADQFNQILDRASNNYRKNAEGWDNTTQGALNHIKNVWADSWKAMMAPLAKSSGQGLGALSKSLETLRPQFEQLGKAVAELATRFAKWLTPQHAKDLGEIVSSLGRMAMVLGKGAWKAVTIPLQIIGKAINAMSGKKGDALDNVATALDAISKNKAAMVILEGIGAVLATQFAYSKLIRISEGLGLISKGAEGLKLLGKWKLSGNILKDLGKVSQKLIGLKNIKINPSNWFKGGASWAKNLFKPAETEALKTGDTAGGNFITRFAAKTNSSRFAQVGRSLGGRIISGVGLAIEAYDFIKDIVGAFTTHNGTTRSRDVGKAAGAGIGAGIGFFFGGPAGAALGGMIGRTIGGKIGPAVGKFGNGIGKVLDDIFVKHNWGKVWSDIGKGWQSFWKGMGDWWDKTIGKKGSHSSKSSEPSQHEIKSLGGNHYSKADIANIKQMNAAVKAYTSTLRTLKATIKKNDPTKELNSMNKSLKQSAKYWLAISKPLKQASKEFQNMKKPLDTISKSMKDLTGKKSGLGTFDKDLSKLDKDLHHSKIGEEFTKLSKQIKKSNLVKTLQRLTKEIRESVKYWKEFAKPVKQTTTEFQKFSKELKPFNGKNNPLDRLEKSVESLTKALKKDHFGNELAKQMQIANKSMSGRGSVESKFSSMTRSIERSLSRFRSSFNRDWKRTWSELTNEPSRALSRVLSIVSSRLNSITGRESSFTSKFLSGWRSWTSSVVSEMQSAFSRLPSIAEKAMSDIISRLNRGISGVNGVISDFGGDKKLSMIHYARGTFAHPGGKAVVNDGLEANKTELIWQPSKGWGTAQGQYVVRDLEAGSMVLDAKQSAPYLANAMFPHYAEGTLSEAEQDKISQEFINNPIQASKNLVLKMTDWNSNVPVVSDLGEAMAVGFSRGIANVLKDLLGIIKEPINGDWTPVIKSAARLMHVSLSAGQIGKLLRQIQTESGGDEKITQQISDVNSAAGHPAQGLLQFIPSTFNTWAMPGHHNILSGFDQIMAAINALNHGGEGGWGNIGNGHGWASGVHMTHRDYALIGDNAEQDEYVINPYNGNALPLMQDAYRTMMNHHPEWRTPTSSAFNSQVLELIKTAITKLDNIDMHPHVTVEDVARPVNKYNAKNYSLRSW
ncbi:tape measure protein [Limosilactobacillus reuteri]|uniref:tape measure protein n=1 Tax=Limosilactobacillus reuteri TaxID=1598 RepID=UPI000A1DE425|nr:tape measure protein [Limosilactobacillus reuteri]